jgi:hypothetical protein
MFQGLNATPTTPAEFAKYFAAEKEVGRRGA